MRLSVAVVILGLAVAGDALAQEFHPPPWVSATRCNIRDAEEAEKGTDRLADWAAVYRAFTQYKQCDDGAIAEGYSDAVAKLFANRWQTLRDFVNLSRQNPEFERFALWHIDTTVNLADDQAIIANARNRCPADLKAICKRLEAKAMNPN